jgi:hypothetical protein
VRKFVSLSDENTVPAHEGRDNKGRTWARCTAGGTTFLPTSTQPSLPATPSSAF